MEKEKIFWLTGISGAGKTTLATLLKAELASRDRRVQVLDGDQVRAFFEGDLGYSRKERMLNVRRIAFGALLLAEHGINVVVANIAPYYEVRDFIRDKLGDHYVQIYVKASLETVMKRDSKGIYEKYKSGEMTHIIGADDAYDVPRSPDLTVDTDTQTVEESFRDIVSLLDQLGV